MTTKPKLRKSEVNALGRMFAAEIEGRLPFQSKAKIFRDLVEAGLASPVDRFFGSGAFTVRVSGYELTHAGRIAYCETCADAPEPREE